MVILAPTPIILYERSGAIRSWKRPNTKFRRKGYCLRPKWWMLFPAQLYRYLPSAAELSALSIKIGRLSGLRCHPHTIPATSCASQIISVSPTGR
jgi:hypothetical protein